MSDINWTISEPGKQPIRTGADTSKEKIAYISQLKSNDQMTDGQKLTITNYNLMRNTLIKNGLMEDK